MNRTNNVTSQRSPRVHPRAFTLVELLVVIGILVLLIAILMPMLSRARIASYVAATQARIGFISTAIEQYYGTYQAYPGPVPEYELMTSTTGVNWGSNTQSQVLTSTENCVVGLLGGWVPGAGNSGITDGIGGYDYTKVGSGPAFLNNAKLGQRGPPIGEFHSLGIVPANNASGGWNAYNTSGSGLGCKIDTVIPEFTDAFPEAMPILYFRARVGAGGMATPGVNNGYPTQYDLGQAGPYIMWNSSANTGNVNAAAAATGQFPDPNAYPPSASSVAYGGVMINARTAADSYLAQDTVTPNNSPAGSNADGTGTNNNPVQKNKFLLVAAGPPDLNGQRVYGTLLDIRN